MIGVISPTRKGTCQPGRVQHSTADPPLRVGRSASELPAADDSRSLRSATRALSAAGSDAWRAERCRRVGAGISVAPGWPPVRRRGPGVRPAFAGGRPCVPPSSAAAVFVAADLGAAVFGAAVFGAAAFAVRPSSARLPSTQSPWPRRAVRWRPSAPAWRRSASAPRPWPRGPSRCGRCHLGGRAAPCAAAAAGASRGRLGCGLGRAGHVGRGVDDGAGLQRRGPHAGPGPVASIGKAAVDRADQLGVGLEGVADGLDGQVAGEFGDLRRQFGNEFLGLRRHLRGERLDRLGDLGGDLLGAGGELCGGLRGLAEIVDQLLGLFRQLTDGLLSLAGQLDCCLLGLGRQAGRDLLGLVRVAGRAVRGLAEVAGRRLLGLADIVGHGVGHLADVVAGGLLDLADVVGGGFGDLADVVGGGVLRLAGEIGGERAQIDRPWGVLGELLHQALAQRGQLLDGEVAGADRREQRPGQVVEAVGELLDRILRDCPEICHEGHEVLLPASGFDASWVQLIAAVD